MSMPATELEHELKRWDAWDRFLDTTRMPVHAVVGGRISRDVDTDIRVTLRIAAPSSEARCDEVVLRPRQTFYYVQDGPVLPEDEPAARRVRDDPRARRGAPQGRRGNGQPSADRARCGVPWFRSGIPNPDYETTT